jgi:hypothetical protein
MAESTKTVIEIFVFINYRQANKQEQPILIHMGKVKAIIDKYSTAKEKTW